MDKQSILPILYDLAVTIGEQTSLKPLLTRTLQRFLYHTSFPAGFISLSRSPEPSPPGQISITIDTAVGDFNLVNTIGQSISVPEELLATAPAELDKQREILARFEKIQGGHHSFLYLSLNEDACIVLLAPSQPDTKLPLNQIFRPILAHLSRAIMLCQRSDDYISALKSDRELFAEVFNSSASGVIVTNIHSKIVAVNSAFTQITGYTADEIIGESPGKLSSGRHDQDFYRSLWQSIKEKGHWQGEIWNRRKNGEAFPEWLSISVVRDSEGHATHYVGIFSDLSTEKEAELLRHRIAFQDPVTDLPNRRLLVDRLSQVASISEQSRRYGAVLSIGLDGFKNVTDHKGHDIGNLVLKEAARRILQHIQGGDTVSCLGGDEFVVVVHSIDLNPATAATHAEQLAKNLLQSLGQPYILENTSKIHSSASIGITLFVGNEVPVEDLLRHSDMAMTLARRAGGNTVQFFDLEMQTQVEERVKLLDGLRDAIQLKQLSLHLQPQIDAQGGISGAEVLLRWTHPVFGVVSPAQFIPLAEESGLIIPLGRWVLESTCQLLAVWRDEPILQKLTLAVNVSPLQFMQADFVDEATKIIHKYGVNMRLLKIELTEGAMIHDIEDVIRKMQRIKLLGISVSLDDFGTGYSSLQYLQKLPLDQIKIDQSFVRNLDPDAGNTVIIKTIIGMARSLGLQIIAEGVETQQQKDFLERNDCHNYQGYLFSRPLTIEKFESLIRTSDSSRDFQH